jgi:hypothetical protein
VYRPDSVEELSIERLLCLLLRADGSAPALPLITVPGSRWFPKLPSLVLSEQFDRLCPTVPLNSSTTGYVAPLNHLKLSADLQRCVVDAGIHQRQRDFRAYVRFQASGTVYEAHAQVRTVGTDSEVRSVATILRVHSGAV